jgi:glutamate synthase (NADPH/NADH) large chain/glutamate synthase (ferredoxin)
MNGIDLTLEGEANDYVGKGMAGGRIVIRPSRTASANFVWHENSIVGNTLLYGATGGEVFLAGRAGERFCVRNSGAKAVIEGVGDHGCEYMTGGIVVCLGQTGRNFAAGMSGGFAFIYDEDRRFTSRCNMGMVDVEQLTEREDLELVKRLIADHVKFTASPRGKQILESWNQAAKKFVKVFPHEYRRILAARAKAKEPGKA